MEYSLILHALQELLASVQQAASSWPALQETGLGCVIEGAGIAYTQAPLPVLQKAPPLTCCQQLKQVESGAVLG